jgi:hypothetical protein
MSEAASAREERELREDIQKGRPLSCPRCHAPLRSTPVPPRSDVSYVRNRVLLECELCDFLVALDKR